MIAALVEKDLKLYFRNRFFALITVLGLLFYVVIYYLLPAHLDEQLTVAISIEQPDLTTLDERIAAVMEVAPMASAAELQAAVEAGHYAAGMVLSAAEVAAIERGEDVRVNLYLAPGTPGEISGAVGELFAFLLNWVSPGGVAAALQFDEIKEVLGPDLLEQAMPLRDRLLPMLLLLMLAMETLGLATIITQEASQGTARAVLTTPLRATHFFAGKVIMGVGLAFVQALFLVVVTGKFLIAPGELVVILLVGSLLVTGVAFLIAAVSRSSMAALGWGMLALIGLALPATVIIFPAIHTGWADLFPSYFLVDSLHRTLNFAAGWADIGRSLLLALGASLAALAGGTLLLGRRLANTP